MTMSSLICSGSIPLRHTTQAQLPNSIMEATSKSSVCFNKFFYVLHVCVTVALVVSMVFNQLTNNARLDILENQVNLQCDPEKNQQSLKSTIQHHFIAKRDLRAIKKNQNQMNFKDDTSNIQQQEDKKNVTLICLDRLRAILQNDTFVRRQISEMNVCEHFRGPPGKPGVRGLRGKKGKRGSRGVPGQKGRTGNKGIIGKHGPPGPRGEKGFSGNVTVIGLKGDMGRKGDKGDTGNPGMKGHQGIKGSKGDSGGAKGNRGEPGRKGDNGPRGCPGDSFAAPKFHSSSSKNLVFNERTAAILFCNATANPYPQITWYRDNAQISNGSRYVIKEHVTVPKTGLASSRVSCSTNKRPFTQSSLIIKSVQANDAGSYFCKARNVMGVFKHPLKLLVQVHVQFTVIPSNVLVVEKSNVRLNCRATGVPSPIITWQRKDGKAMPSVFRVVLGDLHITRITKQDEGVYECVSSNVLGVKTAEATITVNVYPEISYFRDKSTTINESQTLDLPCNATGFPAPEVRWHKSNDVLPPGRYAYNTQSLTVSDVTYEDRGEYVCTANNTLGTVSKRTNVIVQVGPRILKKPKTIEYAYRGYTATLAFEVFAFPPASIEWKKNGLPVKDYEQANSNLTMKDVTYQQSGHYQLIAKNILGTVKAMTFLIVRDAVKPAITLRLSKVKAIFKGRSLLENCSAIGIPTPTIVWKHDDTILSSTTSKSLTLSIPSVQSKHSGRYTCEASNRFGSSQQHFDLDVHVEVSDPVCSSYTTITDATRNVNYGKPNEKCDKPITVQWYRLTGAAGVRMPTSCVPINHCDTDAPGWLSDPQPSIWEGIVSRKVCFHWSNNCCKWNQIIRMRNCGNFYVYEFKPPPYCTLRYCGTT